MSLFNGIKRAVADFAYDAPAQKSGGGSQTGDTPPISLAAGMSMQPTQTSYMVSDAFKEALIRAVSDDVPELRTILENAALIAEDVPDKAKRMKIVIKQARLSPTDISRIQVATRGAVTKAIEHMESELRNEEQEKVTGPKGDLATLRAQHEAKTQELAAIAQQIAQAQGALSAAEQEIARGREKSKIGAQLLTSWSTDIDGLLSSNVS